MTFPPAAERADAVLPEVASNEAAIDAQRRHPLRQRAFTLFLTGSLISWIGDWMDFAALNWAVLQLTGSALDLGFINVCRLAPIFILSIPAGILADRYDRRRLLLLLQAGLMLLTFVVGGLFALRAPFWAFAVAVTLRSSLAAMVLPIRNALLPNLVDRPSLASAVALQTAGMNVSRIIGPALAGWLLAVAAVQTVFLINAASFIAVLATTWAVQIVAPSARSGATTVIANLSEAIAYVRRHRLVRSLLTLAVVPMVFGFPYTALMPLFARDLWNVGPQGFGLLLSSAAVGALVGASWLAFFAHHEHSGRRLIGAIVVFGAALILCAVSTHWTVALIGMALVGWASQSYRTLSRVTLQAEVPDHLRGRIISIALLDRGLIPLGVLLLSALAEAAGTRTACLLMGLGCILLTLATVALDRRVWRI